MATSPMHMDSPAQGPAPKAGKPPLTANPAFPWIVALWFAALLGIGSLVVPVALLERASEATGLAGILPMAAPPLGLTAQALVALVGTVIGGAMGLFLARKIVAPKAAKSVKVSSRKVLNPVEDLGDDGIEGDSHDDLPAPATTGRRRALAIAEEEGPSDFLNVAPLPGVSDRAGKPVDATFDEAGEEPLEMSADMEEPAIEAAEEFEEPRQEFQPDDEPRQVFQPDPAPEPEEDEPLDLEESAELAEEEPAAADEPAERQEFRAVATASTPVVEVEYSEPQVAKATASEPLPFSPPSMAREDEGVSEQTFAPECETGPESEETVSDKQIFDAQDAPADEAHEMAASEPQVFEPVFEAEEAAVEGVEDAAAEPQEETGEGLVQLVQRLGSTLDKHREWSAEQAALKVAAAPVVEDPVAEDAEPEAEAPAAEAKIPDEFDPAAAEDAAQAMAAYFGSPVAAPAQEQAAPSFEDEDEAPRQRYESFRGTIAAVGMDDDDEDEEDDGMADLAASFSLPLKSQEEQEPEPAPRPAFDQPPPSAAPVAEDEVADDADDESEEPAAPADFGAANPFKRNAEEFVRIEEPEPDMDDAEPAVLFPNQEARKPLAPSARAFDPPAGETGAAPKAPERPRPSNDDNERALREALMNLQRMGK